MVEWICQNQKVIIGLGIGSIMIAWSLVWMCRTVFGGRKKDEVKIIR